LILTGCGMAQQRDGETLDETIRAYNESVRWERFEKAAILLPVRQRADAIDQWDERSHDLKITDWELVKVDPPDHDDVHAHIKLSWYKPSEEVLRVTDEVQTWHKRGRAWELVEEARLRGPEMPGLPEPHVHADRAASPPTTTVPKRE
jgi:hypothetical protein